MICKKKPQCTKKQENGNSNQFDSKFLSAYYVQAMGTRPMTDCHFWNFVFLMKCNKVKRRGGVELLATGLSLPSS